MAKSRAKKPIYKKWWFWVVIVLLGLGGLGTGGGDENPDNTDDAPALETVAETPSRAVVDPDIDEQRMADEAAAEDAREQAALAELREIPTESVQEISAPQKEPVQETPPTESQPAQEITETDSEPDAPVEEPTPEPEPEPPKESVKVSAAVHGAGRMVTLDSGSLVWLSASGEKFHSINNCGNMNPDKARQVTINYAVDRGFDACENCW